MNSKNNKLLTGILILVLLGMTACASVYDDRAVAMKMVDALITPQKFLDEKKTEKVNVKNIVNSLMVFIFMFHFLIERPYLLIDILFYN